MTADYNFSSNSILDQNQLQSNGLNTPPNLYMSTGVGGGKKKKSRKGGNCGCNHNNSQTLSFMTKGGKKQRNSKKSKKGVKNQRKSQKKGQKCPW